MNFTDRFEFDMIPNVNRRTLVVLQRALLARGDQRLAPVNVQARTINEHSNCELRFHTVEVLPGDRMLVSRVESLLSQICFIQDTDRIDHVEYLILRKCVEFLRQLVVAIVAMSRGDNSVRTSFQQFDLHPCDRGLHVDDG